jgi:alpha-amylase/alpha-mannosidase (GH57 family)
VTRSVVVHGHFYQPPRENPGTGVVDREPSAAPFHDWNQRIESECYAPMASARVLGPDGSIANRDNLYAAVSFDVGPTLFEWLEKSAPATYAAILEADRISAARLGHGNAIAMPYHHVILPLASRRDKVTEVRWGIADFRRRFAREPEGMWLPETAVDEETLEVLAEEGIRFTVLAPHQVESRSPSGMPLRFRGSRGRELAICVYDAVLSGEIAFGRLLTDGALLASRLAPSPSSRMVVSGGKASASADAAELTAAATDGETFGHHHRFGEMALARAFRIVAEREDVRIENFASFLARNLPREDAVLVAPSSWSCTHGVERWRSDCGCRMAPGKSNNQAWRGPLRDALEWLSGELHKIFEREGRDLFSDDPWRVRDRYGEVMGLPETSARAFAAGSIGPPGDRARIERATELLELERGALRMFTSCAWFFDDLARIETIQVLRYAAFAIELSGDAARLEAGLLARIGDAKSNDPAEGTGRDIWLTKVKPHQPVPSLRA